MKTNPYEYVARAKVECENICSLIPKMDEENAAIYSFTLKNQASAAIQQLRQFISCMDAI